MKQLLLTAYEYRRHLDGDDLKRLTKQFEEVGEGPNVVAHYTRLDGRGGFLVQEVQEDPEKNFEVTIRYGPWIEFESVPVTTIADAFPVIQRVYG